MSLLDEPELPFEAAALLPDRFQKWFASRGWLPREHQLALLRKAREDRSALLIAPTGAGKTLAGFLPMLVELSDPPLRAPRSRGLHTLYISPLKALAVDIARNLATPIRRCACPSDLRRAQETRRHRGVPANASRHPSAVIRDRRRPDGR